MASAFVIERGFLVASWPDGGRHGIGDFRDGVAEIGQPGIQPLPTEAVVGSNSIKIHDKHGTMPAPSYRIRAFTTTAPTHHSTASTNSSLE
jgi:hypothetical protein